MTFLLRDGTVDDSDGYSASSREKKLTMIEAKILKILYNR